MLPRDRGNISLKAMMLLYTLSVLTSRSPSRYKLSVNKLISLKVVQTVLIFPCFTIPLTMIWFQFIFSTAFDGKIKAWLYDCVGSRVDYDAPGLSCTVMAYSADGTR